jgi:hypothetical protein
VRVVAARHHPRAGLVCGLLLAAFATGSGLAATQTMLDDFEQPDGWTGNAADGSSVEISQEAGHTGMAMRVDFDIPKEGGWIIVRKSVDLTLPENYAFTFELRGEAARNNFEFKLVDPSGKNVWWRMQRDYPFPTEWQTVTIRKARIKLAWGSPPTPKTVGAIELAISSGNGGKGTIWIDSLQFEEREPASQYKRTAKVRASSSQPGHPPERALDDDPKIGWKSAPGENQWLVVDFVRQRDYGGLRIDWGPEDYATAFRVEVSDDGARWTLAWTMRNGKGGRDYVYMPEAESRYVRLVLEKSSRGQGYGILAILVQPLEFSDTPNQFVEAIAAESPPGTFPKYFTGKQTYWTVVGVDGDEKNALLNEEGMLEVEKGGFSIEPFLHVDGKLVDWSAVKTTQALDHGYMPIPSVRWEGGDVALHVTAFAAGEPGASTLYAIYRVENRRAEPTRARLFVAIRPFQVDPPWQSLNMVGGVSPIHTIRFDGGAAWVNRDKPVILGRPPDQFGATSIERGSLTDFLKEGSVPPQASITDRFGLASAAARYDLTIDAGSEAEVGIVVPLHPGDTFVPPAGDPLPEVRSRLDEVRRGWKERLGHVSFELPIDAARMVSTIKSTLAYILVNRDGPRLQPGPRSYARSWIRDGSLTSSALLEMGFTSEPRRFIEWFATYQLPDGKVPCCVDRRGADPVSENDSNGEFVFAVAQIYRYTRDIGFLSEMWPRVVRAIDHIDFLRRQRTTDVYRSPDKLALFGLLPASISHEGYASRPVHSYWDDFFALRALKDAAALAVAMGDDERAESFALLRDTFRADLYASIRRAIEDHSIDYIPGSVELGDFDPSSTAIALDPGGELANLPRPALDRTFAKYFEEFRKRLDDPESWDAFSPYEVRTAGALVRLGRRDEAHQVLDYMIGHQRPTGWNEWPEVIWRDAAGANFIGDMPHTWVGSSFISAVRSFFAYEREQDQALVLAAGIPLGWVTDGKRAAVRRLPTYFGVVSYSLETIAPDLMRMQLSGDLRLPPGNLVLRPPLEQPLQAVRVNGKPIQSFTADEAIVSELPATVELDSSPPPPTPTPTNTPPAAKRPGKKTKPPRTPTPRPRLPRTPTPKASAAAAEPAR